jgi:hypothetical protein
MIPNMVEVLNKELNTGFAAEEAIIQPSDSQLFEFPFIVMTGHGNISFSENDIQNLRKWLLRGGCLYADDDYGMDESFRREIKKVLPENPLTEIPSSHPLFNCFYDLDAGTPKIHKHDDKRPQTFAIFNTDGRLMVLYTYETNITDGWSNAHDDAPQIRDLSFKMGVNILYYLFTNG